MNYHEFKNSNKNITNFSKEELNEFLSIASYSGHLEMVKLLLPHSDPKAKNSEALYSASYNGYTEIVKLLISASDPKANNSRALCTASFHGHIEIVKLLLPLSDAKANNNEALFNACFNSNFEIIDLLYSYSNVQKFLNGFQNEIIYYEGVNYLKNLHKIITQKEKFSKELTTNKPNKSNYKL